MLLNIFRNPSFSFPQKLIILALTAVTVLISLTVHEIAHGWTAYKLGDPTARNLGRLSLDPRKHLDPIGTLMMLFIGVGYAKPVPVNSRYFKKPKLGMALTAAAGPLANFIMAFFSTGLYLLVAHFSDIPMGRYGDSIYFSFTPLGVLFLFFFYFHLLNLTLAIFNLLPIPPFDGSRILYIFLPEKYYFAIMKYERFILFAVLILLWSGASFGIIDTIAGFFGDLFERFWTLIPFLRSTI